METSRQEQIAWMRHRVARAALALLLVGAIASPALASSTTPSPAASDAALAEMKLTWTAKAGNAVSPPTVVDGVAYVGSSDGVYAFPVRCDAQGSGCRPLWVGRTGPLALSSSQVAPTVPVVADGMVYVRSIAGTPTISAFSVGCGSGGATCEPVWSAPTGTSTHPLKGAGYPEPTVADGRVFVYTYGGSLRAYPTNCRGSCGPSWSVRAGRGGSPPVVANGVVLLSTDPARLAAFNERSGRSLWATQPADGCATCLSAPLLADGSIYVTLRGAGPKRDSTLFAYPEDCSPVRGICEPSWTAVVRDDFFNGPSASDGVIYTSTETSPGSGHGHLYAFPAECGTSGASCRPSWSAPTSGEMGFYDVLVDRGVAFDVSLEQGVVEGFPPSCKTSVCSPLWQSSVDLERPNPGVVSDGILYVTDTLGTAEAFTASCRGSATACPPAWRWSAPGKELLRPVVADGALFISSRAGGLFAFDIVPGNDARSAAGSAGDGGIPIVVWIGILSTVMIAVVAVVLRPGRRR